MHGGLLYENTDQFLASAVPYVVEGIDRNEHIVAVTDGDHGDALRSALGGRASKVKFLDPRDWYGLRERSLHRFIEYRAGMPNRNQRVRLLAEPTLRDWDDLAAKRHVMIEHASNAVFNDVDVSMLCTHEVGVLPHLRHELDGAHSVLYSEGAMYENPRFVEHPQYYASKYSLPKFPKESAHEWTFNEHSLSKVRHALDERASRAGMSEDYAYEFVTAVSEALGNAAEYAGGEGLVRAWKTDDELICDVVSYDGHISDPLTRGFEAADTGSESGRGFWLMRQLCDWVEIYSPESGSVVRLHKRVR